MDIRDFKKNAMRDALDKVYSWKSEHTEEYSRFSLGMMKIMHNDFSQFERIFKMAAKYVPTSVLIECQKLFASNTEVVLADDEKTALSKASLGDKQLSVVRESVKTIIANLVETSVTQGLDKKAEWTKQSKEIEDIEFRQTIKNALANTKGRHGRRTILQEELSIDDIIIAQDKSALKEAILTALNDMEHEYETAYIKAALLRTNYLAPNVSFATFLRAVNHFSGLEYKYDPTQRVDSFITVNHKEFAV